MFVELRPGVVGRVPVIEVSRTDTKAVAHPVQHFAKNDQVRVRITKVSADGKRVDLSMCDPLGELAEGSIVIGRASSSTAPAASTRATCSSRIPCAALAPSSTWRTRTWRTRAPPCRWAW